MIEQHYLEDVRQQLQKLKAHGDQGLAQIAEELWFATIGPESNSIAVIMKHLAGNMRSRWTDFLTTDGEKPDRDRDAEFDSIPADTAAAIRSRWDDGWNVVFEAIGALTPADLQKTITIRGEAHTVVEAINRQVIHYAGHVAQIVYLARHHAGPNWHSLSIPKGRSKEFEVAKTGRPYHPKR